MYVSWKNIHQVARQNRITLDSQQYDFDFCDISYVFPTVTFILALYVSLFPDLSLYTCPTYLSYLKYRQLCIILLLIWLVELCSALGDASKILPVRCREKINKSQIKWRILHGILVWCVIGASSCSHVGYLWCIDQITGKGLLRKDSCLKYCLSHSQIKDKSETVLSNDLDTDYHSFIIINCIILIRVYPGNTGCEAGIHPEWDTRQSIYQQVFGTWVETREIIFTFWTVLTSFKCCSDIHS